jgi:glutamine amidotransferase
VTKPSVVVLDYGIGNVHSAVRALEAAGAVVELTGDKTKALTADGLFVPGVGAFAAVMEALNAINLNELIDKRLVAGKPVMGICVGQQVLFEKGLEHGLETEGLGQLPGTVSLLENAPRLPHIGWNSVEPAAGSKMFEGLEDERFYFVHSYGLAQWELEAIGSFIPPKVTWTEYGNRFVSALEVGPLWATQFHPEKSGQAGIKLLNNWIKTL